MRLATFAGRLGGDSELRPMPTGDQVLNWSLAVDTGNKDNPKTMWVSCAVYGKRAVSLQPYLVKGARIVVAGTISLDEYQDKQGATKSRLRLVVAEIVLPPKTEGSAGQANPAAPTAWVGKTDPLTNVPPMVDDDIPF
jgi:single-strand DNA-binding protein